MWWSLKAVTAILRIVDVAVIPHSCMQIHNWDYPMFYGWGNSHCGFSVHICEYLWVFYEHPHLHCDTQGTLRNVQNTSLLWFLSPMCTSKTTTKAISRPTPPQPFSLAVHVTTHNYLCIRELPFIWNPRKEHFPKAVSLGCQALPGCWRWVVGPFHGFFACVQSVLNSMVKKNHRLYPKC